MDSFDQPLRDMITYASGPVAGYVFFRSFAFLVFVCIRDFLKQTDLGSKERADALRVCTCVKFILYYIAESDLYLYGEA